MQCASKNSFDILPVLLLSICTINLGQQKLKSENNVVILSCTRILRYVVVFDYKQLNHLLHLFVQHFIHLHLSLIKCCKQWCSHFGSPKCEHHWSTWHCHTSQHESQTIENQRARSLLCGKQSHINTLMHLCHQQACRGYSNSKLQVKKRTKEQPRAYVMQFVACMCPSTSCISSKWLSKHWPHPVCLSPNWNQS